MAKDGAWYSVLVEVENLLMIFLTQLHGMKGDAYFQSKILTMIEKVTKR